MSSGYLDEFNQISKEQNTVACWLRTSGNQWGVQFLAVASSGLTVTAVRWGEVIHFLFYTEMAAEE